MKIIKHLLSFKSYQRILPQAGQLNSDLGLAFEQGMESHHEAVAPLQLWLCFMLYQLQMTDFWTFRK